MSRTTDSDAPMGVDWASKTICAIGEAVKVVVHRGKRKGQPHIKYASAHDLRRSFATRWATKVMPSTLQKIMRHRSITTTMAYYVDQESEAVGDLLRAISGSPVEACNKSCNNRDSEAVQEKRPLPETLETKGDRSGGYRARTCDLLAARALAANCFALHAKCFHGFYTRRANTKSPHSDLNLTPKVSTGFAVGGQVQLPPRPTAAPEPLLWPSAHFQYQIHPRSTRGSVVPQQESW